MILFINEGELVGSLLIIFRLFLAPCNYIRVLLVSEKLLKLKKD